MALTEIIKQEYSSESLNINKDVLSLFERDDRIIAVYLHGSFARGVARKDSDIDLAVLPKAGRHFSDYERALLASEISMLLNRTIDIGELSSKNLVYAKEVLNNGVPIFIKDTSYAQFMTMTLLSMYAVFNEDRSELLRAWTS